MGFTLLQLTEQLEALQARLVELRLQVGDVLRSTSQLVLKLSLLPEDVLVVTSDLDKLCLHISQGIDNVLQLRDLAIFLKAVHSKTFTGSVDLESGLVPGPTGVLMLRLKLGNLSVLAVHKISELLLETSNSSDVLLVLSALPGLKLSQSVVHASGVLDLQGVNQGKLRIQLHVQSLDLGQPVGVPSSEVLVPLLGLQFEAHSLGFHAALAILSLI